MGASEAESGAGWVAVLFLGPKYIKCYVRTSSRMTAGLGADEAPLTSAQASGRSSTTYTVFPPLSRRNVLVVMVEFGNLPTPLMRHWAVELLILTKS